MDHQEFSEVCKRVHEMLITRVEKAKSKRDAQPTKRAEKNHVEAAKDAFAFSHMMELVEAMSNEISELRTMLSGMAEMREEMETPEMFSTGRKNYLN